MGIVIPDGPRVMYVFGRADDVLSGDAPGRYFWVEMRLAESDELLAALSRAHEDAIALHAKHVPVAPVGWTALPPRTREQAQEARQKRRFERARAAAARPR